MKKTVLELTLSYGVHDGLVDESNLSLEEVEIPTANHNGEECWIIPCRMLDNIAQEEANDESQMIADDSVECMREYHERIDNGN